MSALDPARAAPSDLTADLMLRASLLQLFLFFHHSISTTLQYHRRHPLDNISMGTNSQPHGTALYSVFVVLDG